MIHVKRFVFLLAVVAMPMVLLAQSSRNHDYYYYKGLEFSDSATARQAVAILDTALLLKPRDPDTYVARGKAKVRAGLYKEALKDYDWAVSYAKKNDKLRYVEKKEEELTGSWSIRLVSFTKPLLKYVPTIPVARRTELYSDADILEIFNDQISSYPDSASVFIDRAGYYYRQGKYPEAVSDLKKAVEIGPTPFDFNLLGCIMNFSKSYADRKISKVYDDCVNKNFTDGWAYYYRAQFYDGQAIYYKSLFEKSKIYADDYDATGNYNKAMSDYQQAVDLTLKPFWYADIIGFKQRYNKYTDAEILDYYGRMLFLCNYGNKSEAYLARSGYYSSTERNKEAVADLDSSIHFGRDNAEAYLLRADLRDRLGTYGSDDILSDLNGAKALKEKSGNLAERQLYDRLFSKYGKQ